MGLFLNICGLIFNFGYGMIQLGGGCVQGQGKGQQLMHIFAVNDYIRLATCQSKISEENMLHKFIQTSYIKHFLDVLMTRVSCIFRMC